MYLSGYHSLVLYIPSSILDIVRRAERVYFHSTLTNNADITLCSWISTTEPLGVDRLTARFRDFDWCTRTALALSLEISKRFFCA
jgi:hypothetical protein